MLTAYLDSLSNAHFRTAGYILGETIMPGLDANAFWYLFTLLYNYNAKAFLVTGAKAASGRVGELRQPAAVALWQAFARNRIDATKALQVLLPVLDEDVETVRFLLNEMLGGDYEQQIAVLLRVQTPAAAYNLFLAMRHLELDRALLIRTTCFLIKKGDALSFNLASLFKEYFGLYEVKGTFSLSLKPFELARLETSYEAFRSKIVTF